MSKIYYCHYHPSQINGNREEIFSDSPIPYDYDKSGQFSDCIYHTRNSGARFYVVVCGYEKGCPQQLFVQKNNRYILHFIMDGKGFFNGMPIEKGDVCIAIPNQEYTIQHSERSPMTMGWISLSGKELELLVDMLHLPKSHAPRLDDAQLKRIEAIFLDTVYKSSSHLAGDNI